MPDRRRILALYKTGKAVALVTLIRVEGSSYRRVGARLLIASDGETAGSISGGCLEAEVIRKAQWLVRDGSHVIEKYSTLFDDTAEIPYGLGCGGTVHLLIEPANTPAFTTLMQALEASLDGHLQHLTTHLTHPLHRTSSPSQLDTLTDPLTSNLFHETLTPPQRLFLFGAGDDAQPMTRLASMLGWTVTVIDSRPHLARPARFPEAHQILHLPLPQATALKGTSFSSSINESPQAGASAPAGMPAITPADAVILMSHSYEQDRAWLTAALPCRPRYLGLLGSRHRSALLVAEAAALLGWPIDRACDGLFAPVGLDLGGDGPESIALAAIAEVHACCEGKLASSRRITPDLIATQLAKGGASQYLQAQCAL